MDSKVNQIKEPDLSYDQVYTYGDYLTWRFDYMVELIRGRVFKMVPAPGRTHQRVSVNLTGIILENLKATGCQLFVAPFDVILPIANMERERSTTVVQPDLCVICDLKLIEESGCFGAPDWIAEILSPSTSKKDMTLKFDLYEEAGVKEYWIIMPKEQIVEVYVLADRAYQRRGVYFFEDEIRSEVFPDISVTLAEVFEKQNEY